MPTEGTTVKMPSQGTTAIMQAVRTRRAVAHPDIEMALEQRLGRVHARQRLGIEREHEAQVFGFGRNLFHIENLTSSHFLIRAVLMVTGLYWRGRINARQVRVTHNVIESARLPSAFHGFTLLHLSDLHVDMNEEAMRRIERLVQKLHFDVCAITGDFRGQTFGPTQHGTTGRVNFKLRHYRKGGQAAAHIGGGKEG
jgi:hypothetical protein